ncbi:endolytic transglycosylase MltG [Kordiimonas marina]|uniref:endolytic transglycosylase MltG n=1 Tax=Kordiimonas marina TaxID=2872312 RepID=UPI001FF241C8|nr:endolytic transglycosylase MltG [Kordiimonas marina]
MAAYAAVGICLWFGIVRYVSDSPIPAKKTVYYYIPSGSGLLKASYQAARDDLVRAPWQFKAAVRLRGLERSLYAGEYEIAPGTRLTDVLSKIQKQERYQRHLVIPEGLSAAEVKALLSSAFGLEGGDDVSIKEGSVLPDTYFYERGDNAKSLVHRMQGAMNKELLSLWQTRAADLPFEDPEQALILASIVEKETGVPSERPLVAAVFVNRMKKGMRLQSDPTVSYGLTGGLPLDRALTSADLREETPYNTYRIAGLPPTPIANPGKAALEAVLHPADVNYLYFVADGTGGHAFASTLRAHNRNVARWRHHQQKRR